jgi:FkbM family methyltransferase
MSWQGGRPMKFYGQFSPPVDQVIYQRYQKLLSRRPGYYMESGAFDGVTESNCKFLEESLGWLGINVEPFPHHFQKLQRNRPKSLNMNCALSSINGTHEFTHVVHPRLGDDFGNGSLCHTSEHQDNLKQQGCEFRTLKVPTMTYDALVAQSGFPRIDLLSLDVEGHEIEVLKGMQEERFLPQLICIETGHDRDRKIDDRLREMGYEYDGEYLVNSFYVRAA